MNGLKKIYNEYYIADLFKNLARRKITPITLSVKNRQYKASLSFTARKGSDPSVIFSEDEVELQAGEKVIISFSELEWAVFFKTAAASPCTGNAFDIEKPRAVYVSFRRLMPRYKIADDEEATISFGVNQVERRLVDVSVKGLSFLSVDRILETKESIGDAMITINGDFQQYINGKVMYIKQDREGFYRYGVEFENLDHDVTGKLFEMVNKKIRPGLKPLKNVNRTDIEKILEESTCKAGLNFQETVDSICLSLDEIKGNSSIFSGFSYNIDDKCLAFSTALRIYDRTFLGYPAFNAKEVKFDPKPWAEIGSGLADYLLVHPHFENYILYIPKENEWQAETMSDMEKMIGDPGKFLLDTGECYFCDTLQLLNHDSVSEYDCGVLYDSGTFFEYCSNNMSPLIVNAFGYNCDTLFLDGIKAIYESSGYYTERNLFYVKRGEEIVAYAVAESSSGTLNFNPQNDICRIHFVKTDIDTKQVLETILPVVAGFFNQYEKGKFRMLVRPMEHPTGYCAIPGISFEGMLVGVFMDRRGVSEYKKLLTGNFIDFNRYYRLTHPQMAIWHTEKIFPGTSFGNIASTVYLKGDIDVELLEKAINLVVEKNEGFRIRVVEENDCLRQYIAKYHHFKVDLFDFTKADGEKAYRKWNEHKAAEPFKLIDSDLYYFAILKISEEEGGFYYKTHHLISDGWTGISQISRIAEYYSELKKGIEVNEKSEPSYIDFIMSEEEYLHSEKFESHKKFWSEKFSTMPEFLSFKTSSTIYKNVKAARNSFVITEELTSSIHRFCEINRCSPFIVFLSILYVYISRITSKSDIVLGTPVLNRSNVREKNTVGMFISAMPVRFNIDLNQDFISFIKSLSKEWAVLLRYQKYPYSLIQKEFRERHRVNDNLFDVVLSYQNIKLEKTELTGDYRMSWESNGCQTESLQIHIGDRDDVGKYVIDFDYLVDLFSGEEVERMYNSYVSLLTDAMCNPDKKLNSLNILSAEEMSLLLGDISDIKQEREDLTTIHELYQWCAAETPDNVAVSVGNQKLTYRELNTKANSLAGLLRSNGVGPDSIVAIMLEPSQEMIIGVLGVLKAGGAYLPIDPAYPEDRIRYMLEDSKSCILLTSGGVTKNTQFNGITIDLSEEPIYQSDSPDVENINSSKDLAYVIYTSGSTGNPKGVMVEHRSVINYANWKVNSFSITPEDRILQLISFSFDGFGANLYPAILSGAELVLVKSSVRTDYIRVPQLIKEKKITGMSIVPSMYREMLKNSKNGELSSVRFVVLGGEETDSELIAASRDAYPNILLINEYGPTENTIASTCFAGMKPEDTRKIGRPIHNTQAYIVDKYNNLLPSYVPGELCVTGEGLARGYLDKPELTKERFVHCPFAEDSLMYKTGDLARWLADGNIEFLGRIDNQVKIRGFRIELGEIEGKLLKHGGIKEAIVVDREDGNGSKQLYAYYISNGKHLKGPDLREYLFKMLPDYMVPSYFIQLDKMPLSPNGKIDRGALPVPEPREKISSSFSPPANEVEVKLVEAWQEVLDISSIGVDDNIFDYGIDSLTIIRVWVNVSQFGWNITIQDFYEHQSIRKLSNKIIGNFVTSPYEETAASGPVITLNPRTEADLITGSRELKNILLTGATGFLGAHLLGSIIESTQASVFCLVRGESSSSAEARLKEKLEFYFGDRYTRLINKRIFVLHGDITCERLGLGFKEYINLSREIDTVLHAAAVVKHFGDYSMFEEVNIVGTQRMIDFCTLSGAKLNYISTISISGDLFSQRGEKLRFTENDFYIGQNLGENVYLKSKYEAEKMVLESAAKGLDISIYRTGNLTGRYSDGVFQSNISDNRFYNLIKFFVNTKTISIDINKQSVELTPVDVCASAILELSRLNHCEIKVFHLFNDNKMEMNEIIEAFNSFGSNIMTVDGDCYRNKLEQIANDSTGKEELIGLMSALNLNDLHNTAPSVEVSCETTKDILEQLGIQWPTIDQEYLRRLYNYIREVGFIS